MIKLRMHVFFIQHVLKGLIILVKLINVNALFNFLLILERNVFHAIYLNTGIVMLVNVNNAQMDNIIILLLRSVFLALRIMFLML